MIPDYININMRKSLNCNRNCGSMRVFVVTTGDTGAGNFRYAGPATSSVITNTSLWVQSPGPGAGADAVYCVSRCMVLYDQIFTHRSPWRSQFKL